MIRSALATALVALLIVASLALAADPPGGEQEQGKPEPQGKRQLGRGAVTSNAIRDNTVRMRDLSAPLRRLVRGRPSGDDEYGYDDDSGGSGGVDGLDGADGLDGEDGVSGYEAITLDSPGDQGGAPVKSLEAECPAGKVITGGGVIPLPAAGSDAQVVVTLTGAQDDGNGWRGTAQRTGGSGDWTLRVQAFCAAVEP